MEEDDADFEERVAYTFAMIDTNKSGSISYMQFLGWWKKQAKAAGDGGISDEILRSSQEAFTDYDKNKNGGIEVDEIGALLRALDLLKYVPEEVPEPEPEAVKEGLSADELKPMLESANDEIVELKKSVKSLKKEVKALTSEKEDALDELEELDDKIKTAQTEVDSLKEQLKAEQSAHADTKKWGEDETAKANAGWTDAQNQLNAANAGWTDTQTQLDSATARAAEAEEKLAATSTRCDEMQQELEVSVSKCVELEKALADAQANAEGSAAGSRELETKLAEYTAWAEQLEAEKAALSETASVDAASAAENFEKSQAELATATAKIGELDAALAAAADNAENHSATSTQLESQLAEATTWGEDLQRQLDEEKGQHAKTSSEAAAAAEAAELALSSAISDAQAAAKAKEDEKQSEIAELLAKIAQLEATVSEQVAEIDKLTAEIVRLKELLKQQQEFCNNFEAQQKDYCDAQVKAAEDAACDEIDAIQTKLDESLANNAGLESQLAAANTEKVEWEEMMTEEITSLEDKISVLETAKTAAENSLADIGGQLSDLQREKGEQDEYLAEFEAASIEEAEEAAAKLEQKTAELTAAHTSEIEALRLQHEKQLAEATEDADTAIAELEEDHKTLIAGVKLDAQAKVDEMKASLQQEQNASSQYRIDVGPQLATAELVEALMEEKGLDLDGLEKLVMNSGAGGEADLELQKAKQESIALNGEIDLYKIQLQEKDEELARLRAQLAATPSAPPVEIEERVAEPDGKSGRLVICEFHDPGPIGVIFEGVTGADIHVAGIAPNTQASALTQLRQGMLLRVVNGEEVMSLDYDGALEKVVNSGRPLRLEFYIPDQIVATFEEPHSEFGLTFGGSADDDITIEALNEESEAGDMPGLRTGLFLTEIDGESVMTMGRARAMKTIDTGRRPMELIFMEKPPKPVPKTEAEVEVELHCHVMVNKKPWEVMSINTEADIVLLKLVNGKMTKRWSYAQVQHALFAAGY